MPTRDWRAIVEYTCDRDAIVMAPNTPAARGHEAIVASLQTFPALYDFRQESFETEGSGDFVFSCDEYSMTMVPPGQSAVNDKGKVITIWRKQADGSWKMFREIWSSDLPATKT